MKKILSVLLIPSMILSFTACQDSKEVSYTMAVIAIGIDEGKSSKYEVSFAMENGGSEGGEDGGESKKEGSEKSNIISVEAPTISAAVEAADDLVSLDIIIENTEMILLSEDICKKGIYDPIYELVAITDLKNNSYVVSARGKAKDVIEGIKPEREEYASNFYSTVLYNHYNDKTRFFLLSEVYFNMISYSGQDIMLPIAAMQEEETDAENEYKDDINSSLVAGEVPKSSKHKVVFMGGAMFKDEKLVSYMDESDVVAVSMMYGDYKPRDISLEYPKNSGQYAVVNLRQRYDPKSENKIVDGKIYQKITLNLVGDYQVVYPDGGYVNFDEEFTEYMKSKIEERCKEIFTEALKVYESDIMSVGKRIRKCFKDNNEYKNFKHRDKYKEGEYDVEVKLYMRRSGRLTFE